MLKKLAILILLAVITSGLALPLHTAALPPNVTQATQDADWIMQSVITSGPMAGAIAQYIDKQEIRPYMANFAAMGLARAYQLTGDEDYIDAVWNYLNWYQDNKNADGYVHDWSYISSVWDEAPNTNLTNPYDSTDAYAGTYLIAVRAAYIADRNKTKLQSLEVGIQDAVNAMLSTQQSNGLMWAIPGPSYQVQLLEDNVEVNRGLGACVELSQVLENSSLQNTCDDALVTNTAGLETLWNNAGFYYWARHNNGALDSPDWSTLSPDVMEEIWPVAWDIVSDSRAAILLDQLETNQPNWYDPAQNGGNYDITLMGWAYYLSGDESQAQTIASTIRADMISNSRAWPVTPMAVGELIILQTNGVAITQSDQLQLNDTTDGEEPSTLPLPGTPNTGFEFITANPVTTLAITIGAALCILFAARHVKHNKR